MNKQLSIIIPAYNEEDHIVQTLTQAAEFLRSKGYEYEIITVNDGSTDRTAEMVSSLDKVYPEIKCLNRSENRGKGETVKEGISHARFPTCLFMDADSSTSILEWNKFEALFEKGNQVVIGSRHLPDSEIVHHQPRIRRFLGAGYRFICRKLFGLNVSDFNCGFKAYETALAKSVYSEVQMKDWSFDTEVFCLLKKRGVSVAEVPVKWEHRDKPSNLKPIQTALKTIKSIFKLKTHY